MSISLFLSICRKIQLPTKQFFFFLLLGLFLIQSGFTYASSIKYLSNSNEHSLTNILNTHNKTTRAESRIMLCTGNATVVSNNGVDGAANAAGAPDGNYAELHENGDTTYFRAVSYTHLTLPTICSV